jgi:hypothetical protein
MGLFRPTPSAQRQGPKPRPFMFIQNRKRGRVPWSSSLASLALNDEQHLAFVHSLSFARLFRDVLISVPLYAGLQYAALTSPDL